MVVTYARSFPFDPKKELENFQRKQFEYLAAYLKTKDPLVVYEALRYANSARQPWPDWLHEAARSAILGDGRTDHHAERFKDRMRHVQRYRCVRDLRRKSKTLDQALELAVDVLNAKGDLVLRSTVETSYLKVSRDLKKLGPKSEYHLLVTQTDPTVVPVTRGPGGKPTVVCR
jgi:hypothetical protein